MITIENKNQLTELKKLCKNYDLRICKVPVKGEKFPIYYSFVEIMQNSSVILVPDLNLKALIKMGWKEIAYKDFKKALLKENVNA